jgi:hydrogenase maturation protease
VNVVVAGLGNSYRGDDAVGPLVAALAADEIAPVADVGPIEDPLDLLGRFDGVDLAVVVDAVRSGAPVGSVRVVEIDLGPAHLAPTPEPAITSTHGVGLVGVVRLARAVGCAPRRLAVVTVEGEVFDLGRDMSDAVVAAVPEAVRAVVRLIKEAEQCA